VGLTVELFDLEYPANDDEATGYANLVTEIQTALNWLASRKGGHSQNFIPNRADSKAQAAAPAGLTNCKRLNSAIDLWNAMMSSSVRGLPTETRAIFETLTRKKNYAFPYHLSVREHEVGEFQSIE